MDPRNIFVAYHCKIKSPLLEQYLKENNFSVEKKHCNGMKILKYIFNKKPEICIIKSFYEDLSGLEIIREAYLKKSKTKFILVFNKANEIDVLMAKRFNVSGCISVDDTIADVLTCLESVQNNKHYFSKEILEEIDNEKLKNYTGFTDFQRKIIAYIGFYNSPERLAKKLNVAISTVNKEVRVIKYKLALKKEQSLHLWAAKNTNFIETLMLEESY